MNPDSSGPADPTRRFSNRVADYIRFRPGYPRAVLDLLTGELGLTRASVVADVGSGTGILSEMLLREGYRVIGIEPNDEMRSAAERLLAGYPGFRSLAGTAEATTLDDHSVDLITAAQAFHWFDPARTREEFRRILRPPGRVTLIWNERLMDTPFLRDYEALLREFGTDYHEVGAAHVKPAALEVFFGPASCRKRSFENFQVLDHDALRGRLLSSSYVPAANQPRHAPMLAALDRLFEEHQDGGQVRFNYHTEVYFGTLE